MLHAVAEIDACTLRGRKETRDLHDPIRRNARDLLRPGRRIFLHVLLQKVVAKAPSFDERLVDKVFAGHHVEHGQGKGRIRPRPDRHPFVREADVRLHGGLYGNEPCAPRLRVDIRPHTFQGGARVDRLLAPHEDEIAVFVVYGPRPISDSIGEGESHLHGAYAAVPVIRASMGHEEAVEVLAVGPPGRREDAERFRAVFSFLFFQCIGDDADGVIPGDLLESPPLLSRPPAAWDISAFPANRPIEGPPVPWSKEPPSLRAPLSCPPPL